MWFRRIWMIQEIAIAKEVWVYVGGPEFCYEWETLATVSRLAMQFLAKWHATFDPMSVILLDEIRANYQSGHRDSLLQALARGRKSCSSLKVDKTYAILGLTNDTFQIDYTQDSTETYKRLARTVISNNHGVKIFNFVDDHSFRLDSSFPTWAPD